MGDKVRTGAYPQGLAVRSNIGPSGPGHRYRHWLSGVAGLPVWCAKSLCG